MSDIAPLIVSILALVLTFYQLRLQRIHNEKSLKPLPQIDLLDKDGLLYVRVQNNGVGPMIITALKFIKDQQQYSRIQECISFDPKWYDHIDVDANNQKVVFPGAYLEIFAKQFNAIKPEPESELLRQQLSAITVVAEGRDIYDNKVSVEKSLRWFGRYVEAGTGKTAS